jgi:formate dehydrogenase maturation protein FdhE
MWERIVDESKKFPELAWLAELFDFQLGLYERMQELLMGERRPLEDGVLMATMAFVAKTGREVFPILERRAPQEVKETAARMRQAPSDDLLELLTIYYLDDRIPRGALQHVPQEGRCRQLARLFLQPAAPVMLERTVGQALSSEGLCPRCRHRPQWAQAGAYGCSLCLYSWPVGPQCPSCSSSGWGPRGDLLSCSGCKSYLKVVQGEPALVLEMVSVDVDRRARAEGLVKLEPNLLEG